MAVEEVLGDFNEGRTSVRAGKRVLAFKQLLTLVLVLVGISNMLQNI